jgi:hypothetical protein
MLTLQNRAAKIQKISLKKRRPDIYLVVFIMCQKSDSVIYHSTVSKSIIKQSFGTRTPIRTLIFLIRAVNGISNDLHFHGIPKINNGGTFLLQFDPL